METALNGVNNLNELNGLKESLLKNNLNPYKGVVSKQSDSGDSLSIGIMTPEKTQAILNRELADRLEQRFKEEGIDLKGLKAEDFTPQKVSDRIMNFVSGRVLSEQDSEKQQELMQQARAGVEQGFAEARDILDSLSVLNGKVKDDVDKTYDLIQQGLDKLNQQINGQSDKDKDGDKESQETAQEADDETRVEASGQLSMQSRFSRSESTRVEILTNEGDKILVELFKNQSAEQQTRLQQSEDGKSFSSSRSISASAGISYQVEGDLNGDEQQAIDELMANIANVSERFFSGDVQNAFQYARNMDFNTQELTQFSLNMSYQESRQVAISTYGSYLPETSAKDNVDKMPVLQDATETIRQLDDLVQNPFVQQKFADPAQSVSDLLKAMNEQLYSDPMQQLQQVSNTMLDALVQQIKQFRGAESVVADTENSMVTG